jgi:hypothetical protein
LNFPTTAPGLAMRHRQYLRGTDRRGKPIIPSSRLIDDIVYDSVFLRLLRVHDEVALYVLFYFIQLLAAVLRQ